MNITKKIIKRVEHDLKPHNVETINRILEFYKTSNKCCAIQATGTGKTFLILRLLEIYNDEEKVAVIFAPNNEIIKQTKKRMKKFGLSNATFYTYQKLARMTDEEISAMEFDLIVCDELHRTGAKTWGQKFEVLVNSHPDSKVFGVTATPLRCADGRDMAEEYFDGNKACDISLAEALVREIIPVMPLYVSALYTFEEEYQNMSKKIEKANNSMEKKLELQKELLAAKQQLEKANGVPEIIKKYITNYNGKYLVFCKDKKHLYAMKDVVVGWFREAGYDGKIFEYPYYSNSSAVKKNLENFENNKDDGLKLLFIIDKLNEGLHLDEVHGCILLRTTVSNIIYYQQIGRAIDAGSTEQRVILDLVSNFNGLESFNLKKELNQKVKERRSGKFSECSEEFELDKFDIIDCLQECIDIFSKIDNRIANDSWNQEDDEILIKYYPSMGSNIKSMLSKERTVTAIQARATILGVEFIGWVDSDIKILKEKYNKYGAKAMHDIFLPHITEGKIRYTAKQLGLVYENTKKWNDEDKVFLKENYGKLPISEIAEKLNKSELSINSMASKLKIKNIYHEWSDEEISILKKYYPLEGKLVANRLLYKTEKQCLTKANRINLIYNKTHSSKYKYVHYIKKKEKWSVSIWIDGKPRFFGDYDDEDEAGKVAIERAKEYGKVI